MNYPVQQVGINQDSLNTETGLEGKSIQAGDVGGIWYCQKDFGAALKERQYAVSFQKSAVDHLQGPLGKVKSGQIQQWHSRVFRSAVQQSCAVYLALVQSLTQEGAVVFLCGLKEFTCPLSGQELLFHHPS